MRFYVENETPETMNYNSNLLKVNSILVHLLKEHGEKISRNLGQELARTDAPKLLDHDFIINRLASGLHLEASEVHQEVYKHGQLLVGELDSVEHENMIEELGDVLFYAFAIMAKLDIELETVLRKNIRKLDKRFKERRDLSEF